MKIRHNINFDFLERYILENGEINENQSIIYNRLDLSQDSRTFIMLIDKMISKKENWLDKTLSSQPVEILKGYILLESKSIKIYYYNYTYKLSLVETSTINKEVSTIGWNDFIKWANEYYRYLENGFNLFSELDSNGIEYYTNPGGYYVSQFSDTKTQEEQVVIAQTLVDIHDFLRYLAPVAYGRYYDDSYTSLLVEMCVEIKGRFYLVVKMDQLYMGGGTTYFLPVEKSSLEDITTLIQERFRRKDKWRLRRERINEIQIIDYGKILYVLGIRNYRHLFDAYFFHCSMLLWKLENIAPELNIYDFREGILSFLHADDRFIMDLGHAGRVGSDYGYWNTMQPLGVCYDYFKKDSNNLDKTCNNRLITRKEIIKMFNVINVLTCIAYGRDCCLEESDLDQVDWQGTHRNMTVRELMKMEPGLFDFLCLYIDEEDIIEYYELIGKSMKYEELYVKEQERFARMRGET